MIKRTGWFVGMLAVALLVQYMVNPAGTVHTALAFIVGWLGGSWLSRWLYRKIGGPVTAGAVLGLYYKFLSTRMPGYVLTNPLMTISVTAVLVASALLAFVCVALVVGIAADMVVSVF